MCSDQNKDEEKVGLRSTATVLLLLFQVGVQVFTKRPLDEQQKNSFNPDDIINCLKKYPKALVKYLEHLVIDKRLQVSTAELRLKSVGWRDGIELEHFLVCGFCVMSVPRV